MEFNLKKIKINREFYKAIKESVINLSQLGFFFESQKRDEIEGKRNAFEIKIVTPYSPPFWYYDKEKSKHIIALPDISKIIEEETDDEEKEKKIADMHHSIYHEFGHALFTDKDIEKIKKTLQKHNVPFDIVNIFEDIRIENALSKKILAGYPIYKFIETQKEKKLFERPIIEMSDDFWEIIIKLLKVQGYYVSTAYRNLLFARMNPYFERAKNAQTTEEIVDISIEFYEEFKKYLKNEEEQEKSKGKKQNKDKNDDIKSEEDNIQQEKSKGEKQNKENKKENKNNLNDKTQKKAKKKKEIESRLQERYENENKKNNKDISLDEKLKQEIIEHCEIETLNVSEILNHKENKRKEKIDFETEKIRKGIETIKEVSNEELLYYKDKIELTAEDIREIKKIVKEIQKLKHSTKEKRIKSGLDGDINVEEAIPFLTGTDLQKPFIEETIDVKNKINKNIHLFVDLSGSMHGRPIKKTLLMLYAVNEISYLYRNIKINVTFHKICYGRKSKYQTIKLPINPHYLNSILYLANGSSEGLRQAYKNVEKYIKNNNMIYFITDRMMVDEDLELLKEILTKNKNAYILYARKNNIDSIYNYENILPKNKIIMDKDFSKIIAEMVQRTNGNVKKINTYFSKKNKRKP